MKKRGSASFKKNHDFGTTLGAISVPKNYLREVWHIWRIWAKLGDSGVSGRVGTYLNDLDVSGLFARSWADLGISVYLGVSGVSGHVWAYLRVSSALAYLGVSEHIYHIWASLGISGRIWAYLAYVGVPIGRVRKAEVSWD